MGRPKISPRKQLLIRIPEELFCEVVLLHPEMQGEHGFLRYGAISSYFNRLAREDVAARTQALRAEHLVIPHASSS